MKGIRLPLLSACLLLLSCSHVPVDADRAGCTIGDVKARYGTLFTQYVKVKGVGSYVYVGENLQKPGVRISCSDNHEIEIEFQQDSKNVRDTDSSEPAEKRSGG